LRVPQTHFWKGKKCEYEARVVMENISKGFSKGALRAFTLCGHDFFIILSVSEKKKKKKNMPTKCIDHHLTRGHNVKITEGRPQKGLEGPLHILGC
jgi:hypothetical protein